MSSSGLKLIPLSEITHLNYGKSLTAEKRINGGIPVFSSSGITGWHNKALVNEEGIIIGRKGNVGTIFYSPKPFYCIDTAYFIKKSDTNCNFKYLYYLLKTIGLERLNEDSAVPGLNRDTAHSQEIYYYEDTSTQQKIVDILSTLDEKIELNHQTNATLEAMTQAIFKEWFIDFNFPGATGEMIESKLGLIPKGWRVGNLGEIAELNYGKSLVANTRVNGIYPVVGSSGIVGTHNKYLVNGPGIVIGRKGTLGTVTWVDNDFYPIDTTFYITDKLDVKDLFFHYFMFKCQDFLNISSDSAVPGLNRNLAYENIITIPSNNEILAFNNFVNPIFKYKQEIDEEAEILEKIREILLPKFMNGEIEL